MNFFFNNVPKYNLSLFLLAKRLYLQLGMLETPYIQTHQVLIFSLNPRCIGATTLDEYRQFIEKDGALDRRLAKIRSICEGSIFTDVL